MKYDIPIFINKTNFHNQVKNVTSRWIKSTIKKKLKQYQQKD